VEGRVSFSCALLVSRGGVAVALWPKRLRGAVTCFDTEKFAIVKLLLIGIAATFGICFASGFVNGRKFAADPDRLAAHIANNTTIQWRHDGLHMVYARQDGQPYWTYRPQKNIGSFESFSALREAMQPRPMSARSEMLTQWVAGGAAVTVTGKNVFTFAARTAKTGKVNRQTVAVVMATMSGFGLGHWAGSSTVHEYDSAEVLHALRDPEMIRLVKRNVFISAFSNIEEAIKDRPLPTAKALLAARIDAACSETPEAPRTSASTRSELSDAELAEIFALSTCRVQAQEDEEATLQWTIATLKKAMEALSSDQEVPADALVALFLYESMRNPPAPNAQAGHSIAR
jgi:hypothetical protein